MNVHQSNACERCFQELSTLKVTKISNPMQRGKARVMFAWVHRKIAYLSSFSAKSRPMRRRRRRRCLSFIFGADMNAINVFLSPDTFHFWLREVSRSLCARAALTDVTAVRMTLVQWHSLMSSIWDSQDHGSAKNHAGWMWHLDNVVTSGAQSTADKVAV